VSQLRESAFAADSALQASGDLRVLFHRLNNQLGIILACAELLELTAANDVSRTRAAEVVAKVLDAMGTAKEIRHKTDSL
jgi:spore maturation protein SpmB